MCLPVVSGKNLSQTLAAYTFGPCISYKQVVRHSISFRRPALVVLQFDLEASQFPSFGTLTFPYGRTSSFSVTPIALQGLVLGLVECSPHH